MPTVQWQAYIDAHARKEARLRAWECRLHGLKHKSGRALTADDFLPKSLRSVDPRDAEAVFAAFQTALGAAKAHAQNTTPRDTIHNPL